MVPHLPILGAAAQVGHSVHAAQLQPPGHGGRVVGREADVETAVRVQQGGMAAVARQPSAGRDEDGDAGAVLGLIEGGAGLVGRRVERRMRGLERLEPAGAQVVTVHRGRPQVRAEGEEDVAAVVAAGEAGDGAHVGQRHLAARRAGEIEQPDAALDVHEVGDHEAVAHQRRLIHHVGAFGDDRAPVGAVAVADRRGHDAAAGGLPVRVEIERVADDAERGVDRVLGRDHGRQRRAEVGMGSVLEVRHPQPVVGGTAPGEHEQPAAVVGNAAEDPRR